MLKKKKRFTPKEINSSPTFDKKHETNKKAFILALSKLDRLVQNTTKSCRNMLFFLVDMWQMKTMCALKLAQMSKYVCIFYIFKYQTCLYILKYILYTAHYLGVATVLVSHDLPKLHNLSQ